MDRRLVQSRFVKDMHQKNESANKGIQRAKTSSGQAWSNCEDRGLVCVGGRTGFMSGIQENACELQELRENSGWEMLSLKESLTCLEQTPHLPSVENFICILQNCRKYKSLAYIKHLHAYMCKSGLEDHKSLGNYLVPLLAQRGSICDAQQVFDRLVDRNVHSWTSLINGYIECGEFQHALNLYQEMQEECVYPHKYTFVALLKACARLRDEGSGREIHAEIATKGLERDPLLGNSLVAMYAKCGSLSKAQEVFHNLLFRDLVSWNIIIAGYAEHSLCEKALSCFEQMQVAGIFPDAVTFVCSLKSCGSIGAIDKGQEIHAEIARKGLERDLSVGNTLVDMYAKCCSPAKSREAFDRLPVRSVVSWTALIAGYVEHGLGEEALDCFEQMQGEGVFPDALTMVYSLKACGSIGAIDNGQDIHAEIARKGLERDVFVGNTLVDMYAKCGLLAKACEVFDKLSVRNVVSWNIIIAGCTEHGLCEKALNCFKQMQLDCISPDAVTLVCILKACGSIGAIDEGRETHDEIARKGLEGDLVVGGTLVNMYAKCGLLTKAQEAFDRLPIRNEVSWNILIEGYTEYGLGEEALNCFEQMQLEGVSPNALTYVCSLKACGSIGAIDKGKEIHVEITRKGLERDPFVGNTLVDMYAKCGSLVKSEEVFDKLPGRDVVSWNILIAGYVEHGFAERALIFFEEMQLQGISPNAFTFVCSLKACSSMGAAGKGQEIHANIARKKLQRDPFVGNTLIDMYAKCGLFAKAREAFDKLPVKDDVSWNVLIAGYADYGLGEQALDCFKQMQLEGVSPTSLTFVSSLKACASLGAIDKGQRLHSEIVRMGLERDSFVGNTLVDIYAKCHFLAKAQEVFKKLPVRNEVSWNILIAGYAENGHGEEALNYFKQMQLEGVSPYAITFVSSLKACGSIGATDRGAELHAEITRKGLERDLFVGSTLVDMYVTCGVLAKAREIFEKLPVRTQVSWNALIAGYAELGESEIVFHMIERMRLEGINPGGVTFLSVLTVCSHTGLLDKGQKYFEAMSKDYGIRPSIEHHTCMIDLFGRAGQLDEVVEMVMEMPFHPNLVVWHTVMGACCNWDNVELGRWALEHALQLDEEDAAAYVFMYNIYARACMQEKEEQSME